jgi:tRNA threonylcarbamoyladenosine biosynthesis protein TsaE
VSLEVRAVGPEAAADVLAVVRAAFAGRPPLDPPTDALAETEESLAAALGRGGGLLVTLDGTPVGSLLLDPVDGVTFLRRVGVTPQHRDHGVAAALVAGALEAAAGAERIAVLAREELPATIAFWRHLGFHEVSREAPYVRLERPGAEVHDVPDADAMRALGSRLAERLRAGDLVVLSGGLGAGKTTLTQGLGRGLGVRGEVTSPTFVIARVHPSLGTGPALVHADAYRLGGIAELDDLDLDASLDDAVTVVEWGHGVAEGLADSRLEVRIVRAEGAAPDRPPDKPADQPAGHDTDEAAGEDADEAADPRRVVVAGVGPRWERP